MPRLKSLAPRLRTINTTLVTVKPKPPRLKQASPFYVSPEWRWLERAA